MGNTVQYSVNLAMDSITIVILTFLFVTCFFQRKRFSTTRSLTIMTGTMLLLLVEQVVAWIIKLSNIPFKTGEIFLRITFFFDFAFAEGVYICFYYYTEAFIKDCYEAYGATYERNKKISWYIVILAAVGTIYYAFSVFNPNIYYFKNGEAYSIALPYIMMHVSLLIPDFFIMYILRKHRKVIHKGQGYLLLASVLVPSLLSIVDEALGLTISYVILSLFIFVLYLKIDLHKGVIIDRQQKNLSELQTKIMLSQMQPHFLYNVFTTISGLCEMQNAVEARDVVNRFADYFRMNLDSLGKDKFIPFEKELEHIKTYLWLEKVRFEDDLNICYELGSVDFMVPSFAIQPIVENAVKHGIHPKEEAGTLTIRTYESASDYVIEVKDDGVGFDVNELPQDGHSHVGIKNVSERLKILCGGSLEIQSEKGKGTVATIHIPKGEA